MHFKMFSNISQDGYRNLTVTNESKAHVLLNVSYKLESEDPLHNCLEPMTIHCLIGQKIHSITVEHSFVCESKTFTVIGFIVFGQSITLLCSTLPIYYM